MVLYSTRTLCTTYESILYSLTVTSLPLLYFSLRSPSSLSLPSLPASPSNHLSGNREAEQSGKAAWARNTRDLAALARAPLAALAHARRRHHYWGTQAREPTDYFRYVRRWRGARGGVGEGVKEARGGVGGRAGGRREEG